MVLRLSPAPDVETFLGQKFRWDLTHSYEVGSLLLLVRFTTWKRQPLSELLKEFMEYDDDFGNVLNMSTLASFDGNPRLRPVYVDTAEVGSGGKEVLVTYQFNVQAGYPTPDFIGDCIPWLTRASEKYSVNVECQYTYVDKPHKPVAFGYWECVRRGGQMKLRQGHVPSE